MLANGNVLVAGGYNFGFFGSTYLSNAELYESSPTLGSPSFGPGGFQFSMVGRPGTSYIVQTATNPIGADWLNLGTNVSPFTFVDDHAALFPRRFYRALAAP